MQFAPAISLELGYSVNHQKVIRNVHIEDEKFLKSVNVQRKKMVKAEIVVDDAAFMTYDALLDQAMNVDFEHASLRKNKAFVAVAVGLSGQHCFDFNDEIDYDYYADKAVREPDDAELYAEWAEAIARLFHDDRDGERWVEKQIALNNTIDAM
jgi:hypothetical protein